MSALDLVPRRMRTWPVLRRWYWQPEQIAEARRRAQEMHRLFEQWTDDALGVIAADKDLVMNIVEALGHEQAKAKHTDAAMRRLIGDSPISEDRRAGLLGEWHDRLEHTVPWPHLTAEEAADCTICSPSSLPRRTEGGDEHD